MGKKHKQAVVVEQKGNVTWILESSGLSGGVRVIYEEAIRLSQRNWNVDFISLEDRPAWFNVGKLKWSKFADYNVMIDYIRKLPDSQKVVASWWNTANILRHAPREQNYYIVQDDEANYYSAVALKDFVRETYLLPLKKFTTSRWVEDNVFDTTYVGIGVDISKVSKYWNKPKVRQAMLIGRRQHIKGASYQMEIGQRLTRELSLQIEVATVDQGYQMSGMARLHHGLTDEGMAKLYGSSMYFLNTSWHEGFSLPNLEAMAAGCLVVTTNSDGCMEYARDGENCLVVDRNDPRDMVAAIRTLEVNPELCLKIREGGKKTAQEYGWNPVIDRLEQFFLNN